jgi:[NiFe] hydrogenase diaphorase moiety small subunit
MSDVKTVKFTLNGQAVSAPEGQMLADAAADNGVYIPTLCHTRGQACLGTCRVCAAQVNGKVGASCTLPVAEGMAVETETADVKNMQKTVVELLFAEGNHNCPSCEKSGHCDLQAVGYEVGMFVSRFNYCYTPHENETGAKQLWLERDRCIFCQRCVQFVHSVDGKKIFSISGRGHNARIEMDIALVDTLSDAQAKEAADLCPVGAILQKNQAYRQPIGERKFDVASVRERVLKGETV